MVTMRSEDIWDLNVLPKVSPEDEATQRLSHRPTLVIGLGGTGTKVVQKLRRQVREAFGHERSRSFQFLAIDTDAQRLEADEEVLGPETFVNLAQPFIPAPAIVERMERYPGLHRELQTWWPYRAPEGGRPDNPGRTDEDLYPAGSRPFRPRDITDGAGAVRAVGRFALWHHGQRLAALIDRLWGTAVGVDPDYNSTVDQTPSGKIYVICSLAGGTGSGMFLDIAYLLRDRLQKSAMPLYFTGIHLVDATPFRRFAAQPVAERMNANIYAALTELNHFMHEDTHYHLTYTGNLVVESDERPFNTSYLVGVTNEVGRMLPDLNAICNMVAEAIFLEIASPLGQGARSLLDNVEELDNIVAFPGPNGTLVNVPTAFSSLAVASLNYPRTKLSEYVGYKLTHETMGRLAPVSAPRISIAEQSRRAQQLFEAWQDPIQNEIEQLPTLIMPTDPIIDFAAARGQSNRQLELTRERMQERHPAVQKMIQQRCGELVAQQCVQPGGIAATIEVLQQAAGLLDGEVRNRRAQKVRLEQDLHRRLQELQANTTRWNAIDPRRRANDDQARAIETTNRGILNNLPESLRQQGAAEFEDQIYQEVLAILSTCQAQIKLTAEQWRRDGDAVARQLSTMRRSSGNNHYALGINALTGEGLDQLARRMEGEVDEPRLVEILRRWLAAGMDDDQAIEQEKSSLARWLFSAVRDAAVARVEFSEWDLFTAIYHAEILPQKRQATIEDALDRALKRLAETAVPFWTYDDSLFSNSYRVAKYSLLGYSETQDPDGQVHPLSERAGQFLGQVNMVRYNVRDRLVLLQTKHGVPAFVVASSSRELSDDYKAVMARWRQGQGRPIHLQHDWSLGIGLKPLDPRT